MHGFFTERMHGHGPQASAAASGLKLSAYLIGRHHYHIMFSDRLQLCIPRKPQQYEPYIATVTKVGLVHRDTFLHLKIREKCIDLFPI